MSEFELKIKEVDLLKVELDKLRPLKDEELIDLRKFLKIGTTYSSNALEGNTLTEIETKIIIEDGLTVAGKPLKEIYEATGHGEAFDHMMSLASGNLFTEKDILKLHELFYRQIDSENAGAYRKVKVFLSGTDVKLPNPEEVSELMKNFIIKVKEASKAMHPIELAAFVHNRFVTIHPFKDGNGRTGRLLMNLILTQTGYFVTVIPPIYRVQYLETTRKGNNGEHEPFTNFLSCMTYESIKDLIRILK